MYDYNTTRPPLILKEYGRNVLKLIEQLQGIEDKSIRTQKAYAIAKLMEVLNPNAESAQKRWDDLFALAAYNLDIDSPYAKPVPKEEAQQCYVNMPHVEEMKYKYYGRNMELLLQKMAALPTPHEQQEMLFAIVKLMRRFGSVWNNDYISTERIIQDIARMLPADATIDLAVIRNIPDECSNGQRARMHPSNKVTNTCPKKKEIKNT